MTFKPPPWAPRLGDGIPTSVSLPEFMFNEEHGRFNLRNSRPPFVCGLSGSALCGLEVKERVDLLARGLTQELGWRTEKGTQLGKVLCIFSMNSVDYLPLAWAVHMLDGIVTPANAQFTASDLAFQLQDSGAKCLFTCLPLLKTALEAADNAGLSRERIYLLDVAGDYQAELVTPRRRSLNELANIGKFLPESRPLNWNSGEGKTKVAFICYSSGTSGLPKGVLISHYNVIANIIQVCKFEQPSRSRLAVIGETYQESVLGLLPLSHIYGLVVIAHCSVWRGDSVIVLPKFDFKQCLQAIQNHRISTLFLVPPIIILITRNPQLVSQYDLESVRAIFTGAAPLGQETAKALEDMFPTWLIRQAYGLTETCTAVSVTSDLDLYLGSAGSLLPGIEARLVTAEGKEVKEYYQPGELWVKSPSIALGYLNNDKATKETFITDEHGDRWMRTGDEVVFKKAPSGNDHLFVVDRIKELIKVKGFQVAPAELEAHLLTIPFVADCAVIAVHNDAGEEVPKAFVVKDASTEHGRSDSLLVKEIISHVERNKSRHKWLTGGVEIIDVIPKSPSGKILRRMLRERETVLRKAKQSRL